MKISHIIYSVQHAIGHTPQWEKELIEKDTHLKIYKSWKVSQKCCTRGRLSIELCDKLYHNRLNFLMGWIKE